MQWDTFLPILVVPAVPHQDDIRFLCQEHQIDIHSTIPINIWSILSFCNGYRNATDIAQLSQIDITTVKGILYELYNLEVITDSREQYRHFHKISSNPSTYIRTLTSTEIKEHETKPLKAAKEGTLFHYELNTQSVLYQLQIGRRSCRSFSKTKQLSLNQVGNICDYAYSLIRHATPSGGALYPLKIFCVVTRDQDQIKAGYYEYDANQACLIQYEQVPDIESLKYCFNDEHLAFFSPVQLIISADLDRQPYKYSNHGYRLTLIEVGQAAQNIALYCEEQGLSSCELGGILDQPLAFELNLQNDKLFPILAIAIGYSSDTRPSSYKEFLIQLQNNYVGPSRPIKSFGVVNFNAGDGTFFGAWAKYGENKTRISGATGTSSYEASCKAIIEGYERFLSSVPRIDYIGSATNNNFFLPEEIAPLSQVQRKFIRLMPYYKGEVIEWTKDISGKYFIPTDYVYYGHKKKKKLFQSDSSGVAAYTDFSGAQKRAFAELIERDAIMRSWYEHRAPKHVMEHMLPKHILKRIIYWKSKGRDIHVLDLQSLYLPVFLVVIVSDTYPCFVSGAAASIGNEKDALLKALNEAEYNLLLALHNPIAKPPCIDDIKTPFDHGHYYQFYQNAEKIKWLWSNTNVVPTYRTNANFKQLAKETETVFVDLSESPHALIKVVRAVSRKLIPISFGYKRDYYLHPEIQKIAVNPGFSQIPHYFA